jgi:hypothetical protein
VPDILKAGLKLLGAGVLAGGAMPLFSWGPCGPSSLWGFALLLAALVSLVIGSFFTLTGVVKMLVQRMHSARIS